MILICVIINIQHVVSNEVSLLDSYEKGVIYLCASFHRIHGKTKNAFFLFLVVGCITQVIRMRKERRRSSRSTAKLVIGSRNVWVTRLRVLTYLIVSAHLHVFLLQPSLVGQPIWRGSVNFYFLLYISVATFQLHKTLRHFWLTGWWGLSLWVIHHLWISCVQGKYLK